MHRLLLALACLALPSIAQEAPDTLDLESPEPEPVASSLYTLWTASLSQWGQAGDSSLSHQTALSASWSARWSAFRFTPGLRVLRSWQTAPESSWVELEPSAKLRVALGTQAAITVSGWATTIQEPRDAGGSLRLSGSVDPWTGGKLDGWTSVRDSREAFAEGGAGTGIGQELSDRLALSANAGVWWARQVFPSGKTNSAYTPEWSAGTGLSWQEETWSLSTSGTWTWYEAEREVKANKKLLAALATASESVRHDDWVVSLDASWDPSDAIGLWTNFSWSWIEESGSVEVSRTGSGKSKELSPTSLATVQDGPSWELGASWSW
jgi:hypothetical protein